MHTSGFVTFVSNLSLNITKHQNFMLTNITLGGPQMLQNHNTVVQTHCAADNTTLLLTNHFYKQTKHHQRTSSKFLNSMQMASATKQRKYNCSFKIPKLSYNKTKIKTESVPKKHLTLLISYLSKKIAQIEDF